MHAKVTPQIIQAYADVGAVRVPGAVSAQWVRDMATEIDSIIAGLRAGTAKLGTSDYGGAVQFEDHDGYVRLVNVYRHAPVMRALVEQSDCAEIVADVIGSDSMQPWTDGTFLKEGSAAETATPWHNDECLFSLAGEHSPSMWIALTDIDRTNAPLQTLARSNKDPHRYLSSWAKEDAKPSAVFHPWSELLDRVHAPDADILTWEAKAGDMIVIHPKTIHSSLPRTADQTGRRLGFSLRWIGSDVRFEPNPTAKGALFQKPELLHEGQPIPEAILPMVWKRR